MGVTDLGVSSTPSQRAVTLAQDLESSETSTVVGTGDLSLRSQSFLYFVLFTFHERLRVRILLVRQIYPSSPFFQGRKGNAQVVQVILSPLRQGSAG